MKKVLAITMLALVLFAGVAFAETGRLGASNSYSFNPTKKVTKTAAYTVTTSDSQVNVTCSSANIVITLPSVSDAMAGSRMQYKILKTDSTTYSVVVTPASGDTIGGESTRYLINQNAYMVIHAGPGSDWTVDFESPYVVEDHEAGSTDLGTQGYDASIVFEGSTADAYETTLAVTDPTADITYQFPDAVAGTYYVMASSLATNAIDAANAVTGASNALVFEGSTADAYEAKIQAADVTADVIYQLPDAAAGTYSFMTSTLATNAPDIANSVTGTSNGIMFEGSSADANEIKLTAANATADAIYTLPDAGAATYGFVVSSLATNAVDIVNSVTGGTNQLVFEGATADAYETVITPTDPTADNTITLPNASGTVVLNVGTGNLRSTETLTTTEGLTTADCGKTLLLNSATEFVTTLPAPTDGCYFKVIVKAAPAAASYTVVTASSNNLIHGQIANTAGAAGTTAASADTVTFVDGQAIQGDEVEFISDGTNWYIHGTCAVAAGCTSSQAS